LDLVFDDQKIGYSAYVPSDIHGPKKKKKKKKKKKLSIN